MARILRPTYHILTDCTPPLQVNCDWAACGLRPFMENLFSFTLLDSFYKPLQSCCMWLAVAVQIHNATNTLIRKERFVDCQIHLLKCISLYMSYFSDIFAHKHGVNVVLSGIGPLHLPEIWIRPFSQDLCGVVVFFFCLCAIPSIH